MLPQNSFRDKIPIFPSRSQTSSQITIPSYELTNQQLFELVHHHDKFIIMINQLIAISQRKIDDNQASDSIPYLTQAQKILEYAASCGKNIDKKLIMGVLHNQAYAYQRMWQLQSCSNYLQALIFNINERMNIVAQKRNSQEVNPFQMNGDRNYSNLINISHEKNIYQQLGIGEQSKLNLNEQISLIKYHLQFSAVNSQLKNHNKSVQSGNKALKYLKQLLHFVQKYSKINLQLIYPLPINSNNISFAKIIIQNLLSINDIPVLQSYPEYVKVCRYLYHLWEKRTQNSVYPINQELKKLTIGSVMQIKSYSKQMAEGEQVKLKNSDYLIESSEQNLTFDRIIYFIILTCISYFTLSTELRLQSFSAIRVNYQNDVSKWKSEFNRSQSSYQAQIYHLIGLSIYFIYVPFRLNFLDHVLNSYTNHYSGQIKPKDQGNYETSIENPNTLDNEKDGKFSQILNNLDPMNISSWIYQNKLPSYLQSHNKSLKTSQINSKKKSSKKSYKKRDKSQTSIIYPSLQISSKIQCQRDNKDRKSPIPQDLSALQRRYKKIINQKYNQREKVEPKLSKKKRSLNGSSRKIGNNSLSKAGKSTGHINDDKKFNKMKKSRKKANSKEKNFSATYDYKILGCLERDDADHFQQNGLNNQAIKSSPQSKKLVKPKSKQSTNKGSSKKLSVKNIKKQEKQDKNPYLLPNKVCKQLDFAQKMKPQKKNSKQLTPKKTLKNFRKGK